MADEINTMTANAPSAPPMPKDQPEKPEDSPLGVYAPFDWSSEPFAELSEDAKGALMQLDIIATKTDVAARRFEVEQAWEALHFDRGYQHLLRGKQGGWILPGQASGFGPASQKNNNTIYDTNVYGSKGDIIVAALSREVPKVEFFPANPEWGPDIMAAEEAERFKEIWARNNNLHALLVDCARIFWNEDRVLAWTRYELNGQLYGFEGDNEEQAPVTSEDLLNPPEDTPTGQEGLDSFLDQEESPEQPEAEGNEEQPEEVAAAPTKKARGREVTTLHGKLDHKLPIAVDNIKDMQFVQLYEDFDVAIAKAKFPWIADKIKPGSDGNTEVELDRIARENTRQAVLGAYVTGDSLQRHTVVKHTWFRPSMFMDEKVNDAVRAELMEKFPNGALLVKAGANYAFSRNESMDAHLAIAHPFSGKGQNRRSLGNSMISVQKRINDWVDLLDDFFKRTVPKKWMNADAFDLMALKNQTNVPGSTGGFQPQPGLTTMDQYIMVEPTPQPQPALFEAVKLFIFQLSEEITGALPSLFGAATGENTVGNAVIQMDQALQRVGCPWNNVQDLFAECARQAVGCAADCRDGQRISQTVPGRGKISVNTANLSGNVLCFPESNPAFPESWNQKEAKLIKMVDQSSANPALQAWLFSPPNLPILQDGIRMKAFKVPGASSITKQKAEFEILLRSGPTQNPKVLKIQEVLAQAADDMKLKQATMQPIPPEEMAMVQKLQQMVAALPPLVSTVPVAQDESELHTVEAGACLDWLNSTEGQKLKYGTPEQQAAYQNVHLHWTEHMAQAKLIAAANAPPDKPPSESISLDVSKAPANVAIQALAKLGIKATAADYAQHNAEQLNQAVQKKAIPAALAAHDKPQAPPQGGEQPRQLRR
jgi:hypothetical protein